MAGVLIGCVDTCGMMGQIDITPLHKQRQYTCCKGRCGDGVLIKSDGVLIKSAMRGSD